MKTAGKRVRNEFLIKKWIENLVDCMMKQSIANPGFMNMPRLWIRDIESVITAMLISAI